MTSQNQEPKCYLAAPFFSPEQVSFVEKIEDIIRETGWRMFSPRLGSNAIEMNLMIERLKNWDLKGRQGEKPPAPSAELRERVFRDNWENIEDADLLLAVIDNFDVGVMWEVGFSYAKHCPIVTITDNNYGCNLMLAHSIIGHLKTLDSLRDVLTIGNPRLSFDAKTQDWAEAIAEIQHKYKSLVALKEGPDERDA